jgi:DASH complex subunit DAD3
LQQQIWNENEEQQQQQTEQDRFEETEFQHGGYEGDRDVTFQ